jgi:TRAP-type C4-dicarboxylate transport system permease small subunit
MHEPEAPTPFALKDSFGPGGNFLLSLSRLMAIIGGLIFVGLVLMSVVSIVGRKTVGFVVPGDVEVLQMLHGDIKVDFFTHNMKQETLWVIDAFGSLLVGLFGALVAWRAWAGAMTVKEAGETSMILAWPVWIPQAFMVPGFALLAVAGIYMFVHQLRMAARGRP